MKGDSQATRTSIESRRSSVSVTTLLLSNSLHESRLNGGSEHRSGSTGDNRDSEQLQIRQQRDGTGEVTEGEGMLEVEEGKK